MNSKCLLGVGLSFLLITVGAVASDTTDAVAAANAFEVQLKGADGQGKGGGFVSASRRHVTSFDYYSQDGLSVQTEYTLANGTTGVVIDSGATKRDLTRAVNSPVQRINVCMVDARTLKKTKICGKAPKTKAPSRGPVGPVLPPHKAIAKMNSTKTGKLIGYAYIPPNRPDGSVDPRMGVNYVAGDARHAITGTAYYYGGELFDVHQDTDPGPGSPAPGRAGEVRFPVTRLKVCLTRLTDLGDKEVRCRTVNVKS